MRGGVMGTEDKKLLVDQAIPTKRKIEARRPDLVVRLKEEKQSTYLRWPVPGNC